MFKFNRNRMSSPSKPTLSRPIMGGRMTPQQAKEHAEKLARNMPKDRQQPAKGSQPVPPPPGPNAPKAGPAVPPPPAPVINPETGKPENATVTKATVR